MLKLTETTEMVGIFCEIVMPCLDAWVLTIMERAKEWKKLGYLSLTMLTIKLWVWWMVWKTSSLPWQKAKSFRWDTSVAFMTSGECRTSQDGIHGKRRFNAPPRRWRVYVEEIADRTGNKRLRIERLKIIVLGMWLNLSNIGSSTPKVRAILVKCSRFQLIKSVAILHSLLCYAIGCLSQCLIVESFCSLLDINVLFFYIF